MAEHPLSKTLSDDALARFRSMGDPYEKLVTDGNFRAALLKALDGNMIISGAILEVVQRANGNGRWGKVRKSGGPALLGGGFTGVLFGILQALV